MWVGLRVCVFVRVRLFICGWVCAFVRVRVRVQDRVRVRVSGF